MIGATRKYRGNNNDQDHEQCNHTQMDGATTEALTKPRMVTKTTVRPPTKAYQFKYVLFGVPSAMGNTQSFTLIEPNVTFSPLAIAISEQAWTLYAAHKLKT